jgi:hypothetical protein
MRAGHKYLILFGFILSLIIQACRCPSCSSQETSVPKEILVKANEFIKQKTGNDFFEKYISPDFVKTKYAPPYYFLTYRLIMPEKPYVNTVIQFSVDSNGTVVKNRDIIGIPDCQEGGCSFKITEDEAIKIANDSGLEKGIKPWKTGFIWNPKHNQYIWDILSTSTEMQSSEGFRGSGKEIIIDPNSGLVLEMNDWHVN